MLFYVFDFWIYYEVPLLQIVVNWSDDNCIRLWRWGPSHCPTFGVWLFCLVNCNVKLLCSSPELLRVLLLLPLQKLM